VDVAADKLCRWLDCRSLVVFDGVVCWLLLLLPPEVEP